MLVAALRSGECLRGPSLIRAYCGLSVSHMHASADPLLPLWFATATPLRVAAESLPELDLSHADCVVIGAGVTGLSAALHLAEGGAKVVLLEREEPGFGTSGRANGQIIAGLQKSPDAVLAAHGREVGERMIEFGGAAPAFLFDLIERHGIHCDAERSGWVQATRSEQQLPELHKLAYSWAWRGAPVRMLDRAETASVLGTQAYAGGWLDQRNGTVQPLSYARGLAAAERAGVTIYRGVEVTRLERHNRRWQITSNRGQFSAETVVLATNVFTHELSGVVRSLLGRAYLSAYSVQLASEPLDAAQLASVLPRRHSCGDTGHLRLRYFRLDRDNRFVIGGPGWLRAPQSRTSMSFRILAASARRMFPQLANTRFRYRWFARDTLTADLLPHLYEPCAGLFSALGYNGRGLAIGTSLGSVLARRVLGEAASSLPYPLTHASRTPMNLPATAKFYLCSMLDRWRH